MNKTLPEQSGRKISARVCKRWLSCFLMIFVLSNAVRAQTLAFPGAEGFGRYAPGARASANPEIYIVSNLNDSGAGSFRDAVSKSGRIVVFSVGGIVYLQSDVNVQPNITIAGQTATGEGIVFFGKRVTFSGSSNTIARYLRIRLGATGNSGKDASGISNGTNMIFDHMSFTWGMDEVFSINWDGKNAAPDNITVQNSIIGQGLHRENHSAGGLIQTPDGGKVSLIKNLYISNKTRNPKVKGVNEFVNNVVYDWGNGNRLGDQLNYGWSGDAYIMGGSSGVSEVNIINNYFMGGPLTPPSKTTPFSRGTGTFNVYGSGNYFDNNQNGVLDGALVPYDETGYPGITAEAFQSQPYAYPAASPSLSAVQAYQHVIDNVGANYPRRDQVDALLVDEVQSYGTKGVYVYRETDMPLTNGGLGTVFAAPAPQDSDSDGMPDAWEDANSLNKNDPADAVSYSSSNPEYLNIEVYVNSLVNTTPPAFVKPPSALTLNGSSVELPSPSSTVSISWTDNSDNEENFILERSADGVTFIEIAQPAANATSYSDANLSPNTKYYYRIKAVTASESSAYSAVASLTTPPIPTAPEEASSPYPANDFPYADPVSGALSLKWAGSSNTAKYEVFLGTSESNLVRQGEIAYSASPVYTLSGLSNGTTYFWRIDASNDKGTTQGQIWKFKTVSAIPDELVGYWAFDETSEDGTKITDSTDYDNHGVLGLDDDNQSIRVTGKVKNALDFATASTNMYVVSIPDKEQLYLDKRSFSISFWMKADAALLPQDNSTSAYLLCKGSITKNATTGATGKRFDIEFKNKQIRFAIDDDVSGKDELQYSGTSFFTGEWVHVVVIRDVEQNKLQLYNNGALLKEIAITKAINGIGEMSSLVIGNIGELEFLASSNTPAPYKGALDELKLFNYALNPQQVLEQFYTSPLPMQAFSPSPANNAQTTSDVSATVSWRGGVNTSTYKVYLGTSSGNLSYVSELPVETSTYQFTSLTPNTVYCWRVDALGPEGITEGEVWSFTTSPALGIVADWRLDATSGTEITDNSSYQNHGTIVNVPDYSWEAGKVNNSLNLKSMVTTSAISVPSQAQIGFDANSFSISMWIKGTPPASSSTSAYLLHKGTFAANSSTGATGKWYGVEIKNGNIYFAVDDNITKSQVYTANSSFLDNTWVHVVFVRDVGNKKLRIYKNGVLAAEATESTNQGIGGTEPLVFANTTNLSAPLTGAMDEIKLYNYALSGTEITNLANPSTLPVTLVSFSAKAELNRAWIGWTTASEQNSDRFVLERSGDGITFSMLRSIEAKGNSSSKNDYMLYDDQPLSGLNYYRLLQYDMDGSQTVLGTKALHFKLVREGFVVYPNPAESVIHARIPDFQASKVEAVLSNIDGRIIHRETLQLSGDHYVIRPVIKPAPGQYVLTLSAQGLKRSQLVVIK